MNLKNFLKNKAVRVGLAVLSLGAIFTIGIIIDVRLSYRHLIYKAADVPPEPVVIILGASLKPDGTPSDALIDRLQVGYDLYSEYKGKLILITGDDGRFKSNEVAVMRAMLERAGIPEANILVDGQGYRTFESCARAKKDFNITQAIIVTQNFHLPRALYLCNQLGVQSVGVSADLHSYRNIVWMTVRDWLASFKAWIDVNVWTPKPPV